MPVSDLLQTVSIHMNFCDLQSVFYDIMKLLFDILSRIFWFTIIIAY